MHTIIETSESTRRSRSAELASTSAVRKPKYDCQDLPEGMQVIVYIPGVDAAGVEIEARGPDLTVRARKYHYVRVNWQALHLEPAQRDYLLRLRLGRGFDYATMHAEIQDGVLTITLPKRQPAVLAHQRVA